MKSKTISIVVSPGVQLTDVAWPLDVFAEANSQLGDDAYRLELIGTTPGPIRSSSGVKLLCDRVVGKAGIEPSHTLLVAGSPGMADIRPSADLPTWLRVETSRTRRYGSVCSGAFLLAVAGLLDGRRVTTHWPAAIIRSGMSTWQTCSKG